MTLKWKSFLFHVYWVSFSIWVPLQLCRFWWDIRHITFKFLHNKINFIVTNAYLYSNMYLLSIEFVKYFNNNRNRCWFKSTKIILPVYDFMERWPHLIAIQGEVFLGNFLLTGTRFILWMHPANERRRYNVKSSLIGWAHSQNDPC